MRGTSSSASHTPSTSLARYESHALPSFHPSFFASLPFMHACQPEWSYSHRSLLHAEQATVLAHSLGSVIMFDILTASTNAITFPVAQLISVPNIATHLLCGNQPSRLPPLSSPPPYVQVGSPLGLFVAIRRGKAAEYARLHERLRQRGGRLVNIFHRVDPIASRVGPLLQGTHAGEDACCCCAASLLVCLRHAAFAAVG